MHMNDTARSILRRWYIFLFGMLITAALGWAVFDKFPPTYTAQGSLLFMAPENTIGVSGNPYLFLDGMSQSLDVVVRRAAAVEVTTPILDRFQGASYVVEADRTTSSPVIVVTAEASSEKSALGTVDAALETVRKSLLTMQEEVDVRKDMRMTTMDLVIDKKATLKTKTRLQLAIGVIGAGVVGTTLFTGFIDGWILQYVKNKRGRKERSPSSDEILAEPNLPQDSKRSSNHVSEPPNNGSRTTVEDSEKPRTPIVA